MNQSRLVKSGFFYGYVIAVAAFCIIFAVFGIRLAYGVFFKPISSEFGWNSVTMSLAFSISVFLEGVFNVILGHLTDKYGPRLIIMTSGIVIGLGYCLMPLVQSVWQFYLLYGLIIGTAMGGTYVPLISVIARWFKARRTLISGIVMCGSSIGMLILSPGATELITRYGWRTTFLVSGISIIVVISIAAQFLKRDPSALGLQPYGETASLSRGERQIPVQGLTFKEAIKTRQLWLVFLLFASCGFYQSAIGVHLVPDAISTGISPTVAAYMLSTIGGLSIVGRIGLGILGDRFGNKLIYVLGFAIFAVSIFWIIVNDSPLAFFGFAAIHGIAQGGMTTSQSPIVASLFGLRSLGLIFGFCGFGCTLGMAIGPYVAGYIFDRTQDYDMALIYCAIISIIALVLVLLLKPVKGSVHAPTKV